MYIGLLQLCSVESQEMVPKIAAHIQVGLGHTVCTAPSWVPECRIKGLDKSCKKATRLIHLTHHFPNLFLPYVLLDPPGNAT